MEEQIIVVPAPAPVSSEPAKKPTKAKAKPTHPAWAIMITDAVKELHEKRGSSVPKIKKFIVSHNNNVDKVHLTPHMRRGVKAAIAAGMVIQAKGHGLTGSFKLGGMKAAKKTTKTIEKKDASEDKKKASPKKAVKKIKKATKKTTEKEATPKKAVKKSKTATAPKAKKPAAKKTMKSKPKAAATKKNMKPKALAMKAPKSPKTKTTKTKKVTAKPKAKTAAAPK